MAHIVVEATSLAEDINHAPDLVGKPAGHGSPSVLRDCLMTGYHQGWRVSTAHILHSPQSGRAQALCELSPRQSFRRRISSHYALLGRGSQDSSYCPEYLEAFGNLGGVRHHELVSLVCICRPSLSWSSLASSVLLCHPILPSCPSACYTGMRIGALVLVRLLRAYNEQGASLMADAFN